MRFWRFGVALAASLAGIASVAMAADHNVVTIIDDKVFPESVTSTRAGDLIIGSSWKGGIYRAKAGSDRATLWIDPAQSGLAAVLGVFADDMSNTLYVCSVAPGIPGVPGPPKDPKYAQLRTFDLVSGAPTKSYPMIDPEKARCNDIDVDKDGTAYITDTGAGQILRLKKGAAALDLWVKDDRLTGADGVALGDKVLYVGAVTTSRLFSIPIAQDGAAGTITELQPSIPLARPDGMRSLGGNKFLMAEQSLDVGRISEVTVDGAKADIKILKNDPGVTAMTKVGNRIWVNNAKFAYRPNGPLKDQSPEPFILYAIPCN